MSVCLGYPLSLGLVYSAVYFYLRVCCIIPILYSELVKISQSVMKHPKVRVICKSGDQSALCMMMLKASRLRSLRVGELEREDVRKVTITISWIEVDYVSMMC